MTGDNCPNPTVSKEGLSSTSATGRPSASEPLFEFLDRLGQEVSKSADAEEIMALTTRLTAQHLNLSNCAYADMDEDEDGFIIRGNWHAPRSPSIVGRYRLTDFGSLAVNELKAGRPLIINDNRKEIKPHEAETFQAIGISATICMPLVKGGRLRALMAIHDKAPHYWSKYELKVIREVTDRSWVNVERVRAEAELRASNDRFRAAVDATRGVLWTNDAEGRMGGEQPGWTALTGQSYEEYRGHGWAKALHPEDTQPTLAAWTRAVERRETFIFEHRVRRHDGEWRVCSVRAVPVKDSVGNIAEWVGVHTDITEEREAERALRESETELRLVLDTSPGGFYAVDREGNTTLVSLGFLKMMGFSEKSEAIGHKLHNVIHHTHPDGSPYPVEECPIYRCASVGEGAHIIDEIFFKADGTPVPVEYWVTPIFQDGEHVGASCTIVEISERKAAERALREESRTLETLNRTGAALAAELDQERLVQIVTDAGVEVIGAQFGAFFYNVLTDEGGSYMLYTLSGAPRSAFEGFGMPRATAIFHPTFVGEGVIRSDDVLLDPRYGKSAPHMGMPKGHMPVRSYLAVPVKSRSGEVLGGLFFGHKEPAKFTARHEELIIGIAGQAAVAVDNARLFQTTQRLNETLEARVIQRTAELEDAQDALRQAQKMEAVGQLTGGIAHDFNNLLTGVIGSLDMMRRQMAKGETDKIERYATTAMTSANRAAALTHRLLAFARRQPLDPKPVNANQLVNGMEELLRRTIGESIELEIVTAGGLWQTLCDPHQLESAILNLAINARDAMPKGGKLTIETCNAHLDTAYAAKQRDVVPGQYICICVSDTGSGMTKDTIEKAFEPFFTTKPIGQGTGLGLSMIYGFARQSEGYARIYSEVDKGTTIKLYLPRSFGKADDAVEGSDELIDEHRAEAGQVILVVEDETAVRDLVIEVLQELGYRTIEAVDGPSGLKLLQSKMRVDLLITDIGLPGLNGRQLADAAQVHRPNLKVLFMTGYAENAAIANGFLAPGMEMITKPFAIEALVARVRYMVEDK